MPMKKKIRTKTFVTLTCFSFLFYYTSIVAFLNVLPPLIFFFNYLSWISYAQSASSEIPLRSSASWRDSQSCPASSSMEKKGYLLYLMLPLRTSASSGNWQSCPARSSKEKACYILYLILRLRTFASRRELQSCPARSSMEEKQCSAPHSPPQDPCIHSSSPSVSRVDASPFRFVRRSCTIHTTCFFPVAGWRRRLTVLIYYTRWNVPLPCIFYRFASRCPLHPTCYQKPISPHPMPFVLALRLRHPFIIHPSGKDFCLRLLLVRSRPGI